MSSETVLITIGGQQHAKPYDSLCPACTSPAMMQIDSFLAYGWAISRIREYLRPLGAPGLTDAELRAHIPHLAGPHFQARTDYEAGLSAAGADPESAAPGMDTLLGLTLQRAYERITDGTADVSVRDVVALAKLRREMERDAQGAQQQATSEQWQGALTQLLWIARKHLGGSWKAFAADVRADEMIAAVTRGQMAEPAERGESDGGSAARSVTSS